MKIMIVAVVGTMEMMQTAIAVVTRIAIARVVQKYVNVANYVVNVYLFAVRLMVKVMIIVQSCNYFSMSNLKLKCKYDFKYEFCLQFVFFKFEYFPAKNKNPNKYTSKSNKDEFKRIECVDGLEDPFGSSDNLRFKCGQGID